ncbi:DapH/DapD/GlmU-related protein [Rossellomorea marisflavi]|uniref:DapH/DapD/GlmU-related protein n=1 Tax=Rossellomorea marisflavi TaxID=189381 RepID=UPI0025B0B26A|nr:DapH/DapD/GlmU-related protein [Rossellomorea marisflavi]WJV19350.1 DapH/DapD/GlmU-related protein [Rossellomorea marisflavi]
MANKYSASEFTSTLFALFCTKLFFRNARLIRRPVYMRGKASISYGKGLTTGHGCRFDLPGDKKTLLIGEHCEMGDYTHIVAHEKVEIGDHVLIASKVFISDTSHGIYRGENSSAPTERPNNRSLVTASVKIGDRVWIGENVVILYGVTIGEGAIIGANSLVNKDVKENTIVAGSPAKPIKSWDNSKNIWK